MLEAPKTPLRESFEKYGEEGQSFRDWLQDELEGQMSIIADSTWRAHHLVGPLGLAHKLALELESLDD